jgi:hypothetical protein
MRRFCVAVITMLVGGCYDPQVTNGQFMCEASMLCPRGFECVAGQCVTSGTDLSGPGDMAGTVASDLFDAGLGDLDLSADTGILEIDTETGRIELLGNRVIVEANPAKGFRILTQDQAVRAGTFSFRRVVVPAGVTVRPTSSSTAALVIAASQLISIGGTVDWSGRGAFGGARTVDGSGASSDVGGGGGRALADGSGSGGGGAGHASDGMSGAGSSGGKAGTAYGSPMAVPLHVGAGGGGGGGVEPAGVGGVGGSGGGAIALISLGDLVVTGKIDVSGNPGRPGGGNGTAPAGGGGGGAGGSLVLSAAQLTLEAGHELRALGGAGGPPQASGGKGGDGSAGRIWIGYDTVTIAGGMANSMPTELASPGGKATTFPR